MNNAEISDQLMKHFNDADWDAWKEFISDDATMEDMAVGKKCSGSNEVLGYAQSWKTGFPDMVGTCEHRIESENILVEECSWTGTNTGSLTAPDGSSIPATGKTVTVKNAMIWEFENGKVKSCKNYLDMMSMLGQLGLLG